MGYFLFGESAPTVWGSIQVNERIWKLLGVIIHGLLNDDTKKWEKIADSVNVCNSFIVKWKRYESFGGEKKAEKKK